MSRLLLSERPADVGRRSRSVTSLFLIALALVAYGVFAPRWLEPVYRQFGLDLGAEASMLEAIGFQLWLGSVPLAVILALVGGAMTVRTTRTRAWLFGLGGVVLLIAPLVIGGAVGQTYGWLFGGGGTLIALLALATVWNWSAVRPRLSERLRLSSDLRMAGYMGFAFAAWFTCGVFALPLYVLDLDMMIALDTTPMALSMAYGMMAFFVVGWAFVLAGQVVERREHHPTSVETNQTREPVGSR